MNFLKNSIFSRSSNGDGSGWEPENENQMLAVWGSPGSGKTTVAVKLAARLALQKRDVALLLCDMNTPMLPCICPPGDLEEEHSLGSILAAAHVSESLVRHNCITHNGKNILISNIKILECKIDYVISIFIISTKIRLIINISIVEYKKARRSGKPLIIGMFEV